MDSRSTERLPLAVLAPTRLAVHVDGDGRDDPTRDVVLGKAATDGSR